MEVEYSAPLKEELVEQFELRGGIDFDARQRGLPVPEVFV